MIYIANTDVECEWDEDTQGGFETLSFERSRHPPLFFQLQFLPLLYAKKGDIVVVTDRPSKNYLESLQSMKELFPHGLAEIATLKEIESGAFQGQRCSSWGASLRLKKWADRCGLDYRIPPWEEVKKINSKAFSAQYTSLKASALLANEADFIKYLDESDKERVLKTCFGLSGRGNMRFDSATALKKILAFCQKEWVKKLPVIAEPWLNRVIDFSSQWYVHAEEGCFCPSPEVASHSLFDANRKIEYIGATLFQTDARGKYLGTQAGVEEELFGSFAPLLQEHVLFVRKILEEIASLGFFGPIGFDAFLYREEESAELRLQPIVEINARQTMSLMALMLQKEKFSDKTVSLLFGDKREGVSLLPDELLLEEGRKLSFAKKLLFTK